MLKIVGINGSPRLGWNTDRMIKKALEGAASVGAKTELVELGKLNFKPCMSCLACKKTKMEGPKCFLKDDLSPVLESIKDADGIILGAPIYFGRPAILYQMFWERLRFSCFAYDPKRMNLVDRQIKSALMFTMNVNKDTEKAMNYQAMYDSWINETKSVFGPQNRFIRANNTQQVKDYSKYYLPAFNPEVKYQSRRNQFPIDLQEAYKIGQWIGLKE